MISIFLRRVDKASTVLGAAAALVLLIGGTQAHAASGDADPFGTAALVSPPPCTSLVPTTPLSLREVIEAALCGNPQTRQVWASARAQAAQVGLARSAYLPNASATLSASRNWSNAANRDTVARVSPFNGRETDAAISLLLYDFGVRKAELESAQQLLAAALSTGDNTIQAVMLAAVQAFYRVQETMAAVDAASRSEQSSLESLKAAEARYKAGSATPADKLQAQTAYSQAVLARVQAEGDFRNAEGELANVMGLDAQVPVALAPLPEASPPETFSDDIGSLVEEARRRRPDLAAARAQLNAARANVLAARAAGMPTVSLSASSGRVSGEGLPASNTTAVGVTVSIPLFSGFSTTYRIRTARAQADATGAQFDRLRLQVSLDVWQAYQNLHTALQSIRTATDLLASAEQSRGMAFGRYRNGIGTIIDLLAAESALANARQQRAQALFNWNVSRAALAQAMGKLDYDSTATPQGMEQREPATEGRKP